MTDLNPQPLRMDNPFALKTMSERLPGIVRSIQTENPHYPATIQQALDRLYRALMGNEPIAMLDKEPIPAPDYTMWEKTYRAQQQKFEPLTWHNNEWFFSETFGFRHVIQAVRWYETRHDPYLVKKQGELKNPAVWQMAEAALESEGAPIEKLWQMLAFTLWGNRADLSHPAGQLVGETASADELLVDDRKNLVDHLMRNEGSNRSIHLVADNSGTELIMDLAFIDRLLADENRSVVLHVKCYPTYVSDATTADVWQTVQTMEMQGSRIGSVGQRLRQAWDRQRLVLSAHPFWVSSEYLWDLPPLLKETFASAQLVILKGDMNYRRAVGDTIWNDSETFATVMDYFPAPVVALRSLKSDALVGVPGEVTRKLDAISDDWRTTGRYGVIQFVRKSTPT